jgi:CheY-like chemotaxis protein
MTKGFVEQSGGALSLESHLGQGTAITLWLPAAGSESARVTTDSRVSLDAVAASNAVTPARVLLVDDEELVRKLVAEQLQDAGYDVLAAPNGIEALTLLAAGESVDAVVTDLSMPGMDGLAVIRAVRKRYPGLPALLLTGYAGDGSALAVGGAIGGAFSLLRKPVTGAQLIDRLSLVLADRFERPIAGSISLEAITSPPPTAAFPPSAAMAHRAGTPPARGGIALPPHR